MTRRDFEKIANAIREQKETWHFGTDDDPRTTAAVLAIRLTAVSLADEFKKTNPRFDRDIFLKACGF